MKAVEVLERAWALIEKPENRTTGTMARFSTGQACHTTDKRACCFCSIGALLRVCQSKGTPLYYAALDFLIEAAKEIFPEIKDDVDIAIIYRLNDDDVINNPPVLYKRAIELARESGL